MTYMLLGGSVSSPKFQTIDVIIDDAMLVHKSIIMCNILLAIDVPIATYSIITLPIKP